MLEEIVSQLLLVHEYFGQNYTYTYICTLYMFLISLRISAIFFSLRKKILKKKFIC